MRTLLRHINRAKHRWKKMVGTSNNVLQEGHCLRRQLLMNALDRQRLRQILNLSAFQQSLKWQNIDLIQKRESFQSAELNLHTNYDRSHTIMLQRSSLPVYAIKNNNFESLQKLRKDLLEKKQIFKEAIDNKTDALNSELFRRRTHFKEALHSQTEKIHGAIDGHTEDLRNAVRKRRQLFHEAMVIRRDKLRTTEEIFMKRGKLIIKDIQETKEKVKEAVENVVEKENIYTIPNLLCVTRIAFSPYLGYLIVSQDFEYALCFMVIASLSDFLDGWIARNFKNQSSKFGSFIDPMADKVLIGTLFLTLTYVQLIPVPLTMLIVARDVVLVGAGFVIRYMSLSPPRTLSRYFDATHVTAQLAPTFISKVNTGVQLLLVGSTLAAPVFGYVDHPALVGLCYVTAVTTILSAASYLIKKDTYRIFSK